MENNLDNKKNIYKILKIVVLVLAIACAVKFLLCSRLFGWQNNNQERTISVSGHGEVQATPDIANISFTIKKEAKTVKEAQEEVTKIEKAVLESLKKNEVAEKDIKTISASFRPKYEYKYVNSICDQYGCHPGNRETVVGYEVYESLTVKIREIDNTGKIIEELGSLGVTDLSGPNFTVDKEDELQAQARKKAIDDAKNKAKALAKDLGIGLGKIISFDESNFYPPIPMYDNMVSSAMMKTESVKTSPELPVGENTISSDVTIIYRMR